MMPVLMCRYGLRGSLLTLLPPGIAVLLAPEIAALVGVSFTFFGAIALVLVLSIGFDYAVFCREAPPARRAVTMLGVCLAMLATLLSFGLLGISRTYAVHAFGITLLAGRFLLSYYLRWRAIMARIPDSRAGPPEFACRALCRRPIFAIKTASASNSFTNHCARYRLKRLFKVGG